MKKVKSLFTLIAIFINMVLIVLLLFGQGNTIFDTIIIKIFAVMLILAFRLINLKEILTSTLSNFNIDFEKIINID